MNTLRARLNQGILTVAIGMLLSLGLSAQEKPAASSPPLPPLPPGGAAQRAPHNFVTDPSKAPANTTPPPIPLPQGQIPAQFKPIPQPANLPVKQLGGNPNRPMLPPNILTWDNDIKENHPSVGDTNSAFSFIITNVSSGPVTITEVKPSCGCTSPKTKPLPWTLGPGETGDVSAVVDLRGKVGTLMKALTVETDKGFKVFMLKVVMPEVTPVNNMGDRARNTAIATADRQSVFRGECANCHAKTTVGKFGEPLYTAACGICHDAEHRASAVPDLKNLGHSTDHNYWVQWVSHGKPGTMMPGFLTTEGGPLTEQQIQSLADFLVQKYPTRKIGGTSAAAAPAEKAAQ